MESSKLEGASIEVIRPVTINVTVSGRARREDGKYNVKWFDGTIKVIEVPEFQYTSYNFMTSLQQVTTLYQLNSNTILSIKLKTI